jgi:hypothetical protein
MGRPAYQREFRTSQAAWADSSYLKRAYTLPMRSVQRLVLGLREWRKGRRTVVVVVTDNHLFNLAVLAHLTPEILVKGVKVVLQLLGVHVALGVVCGVLVEVGEEDGLRV